MSDPVNEMPGAEPADETTARDSEPALPDYQGDEDPDAEALLRELSGGLEGGER
jgi:hypothetical protein